MEKLHSDILNKLPIKVVEAKFNYRYFIIKDNIGNVYHLHKINKNSYLTYYELIRSKNVQKAIFELKNDDTYFLLFEMPFKKSEKKAVLKDILETLEQIHNDFKFKVTLKKEYFKNLQNIYRVLDNRFSYLELRIREIETSPKKNDTSWVVLSKYNVFLDAKIFLYDLQQDIFKIIDNNESIIYGLVYNYLNTDMYKNGVIEPIFDLYYAPYSSLLVRYFLEFDELDIYELLIEKIKKIDKFNQKYFCFMCLYIYVLNVRLDVMLNEFNISCYLLIAKKIKFFLNKFGDYMK
ncbi:MAG: hypothetical protein E7176_04935 [Erysipelotrichaceae bacterium]|nr:hypothetical protein [Erysipelotrichaceae bacterium]